MSDLNDCRSAYIHVPFCAHRCGYCDFTLVARRDDLMEPYLDALERDLASLGQPRPVDTIFFGGGTPTRLSAPQLERLIALVRSWFPLFPGGEFSVEANPSGLDDDRISVLAEGGVTRVSLGVQSFHSGTLQFLERDHAATDIEDVVQRLQPRIPNISLDLIYGVPGQSLAEWQETLARAIALQPRHVSTYGLTFEKGTAFWSRLQKEQIVRIPDDLERSLYATAMDTLESAGFLQYELSNFARSGSECRHNQTYWRQGDFFGHGPGAARYLRGRREINHRSVTTWIRRLQEGTSPIAEIDELPPEGRAREAILLGLRRTSGIERREFQHHTGFDLDALAGETIISHGRTGWLLDDGGSIRLSREGRFVADSVMVDFL